MKFTEEQKEKLLEQAKKFRALGNLLKLSKHSKDKVQAEICDGLAEVCELLAEGEVKE